MKDVDVLLINPIDKTQLKNRLGIKAPPLNLLYLASMLEKFSRSVKIIDDNLYELGIKKVAKLVAKYNPLIVGITAVTATVKTALKYLKEIKKLLPNVITVIGGPHVSFLPTTTLRECSSLDAVVIGEGEETIVDLVDKVEKRGERGLGEVRGSHIDMEIR